MIAQFTPSSTDVSTWMFCLFWALGSVLVIFKLGNEARVWNKKLPIPEQPATQADLALYVKKSDFDELKNGTIELRSYAHNEIHEVRNSLNSIRWEMRLLVIILRQQNPHPELDRIIERHNRNDPMDGPEGSQRDPLGTPKK